MTKKKILIIDDETDICFLLKRRLKLNEYIVKDAQNLNDGFEIFKDYLPDILILDINLPDGNGAEIAYRFKALKNDIFIVLMSADNDQLNDNFKNYNASAFMKKPFSIEQLANVIETQYHL